MSSTSTSASTSVTSNKFNPESEYSFDCHGATHGCQHANQLLGQELKKVGNLVLASSLFSLLGVILMRLNRNLRARRQPLTAQDNDDNNDVSVPLQQRSCVTRARGVAYIDARSQNRNCDKLGLAMGSTIGPLFMLAVISHNFAVASFDCQTLPLVYLCLLASLGFSFALSTASLSFLQLLQLRYGNKSAQVSAIPITGAIIPIFLPCLCYTWNIIRSNIIHGEVSTSLLPVFAIVVCFATLEILFLLHYAQVNSNKHTTKIHSNKSKKEYEYGCKSPPPLPSPLVPPLQQVFTLGEWVTVSSFLSILVTDFFFRFCYDRNYYQYHHNNSNLNAEDLSPSSFLVLVPPIHNSYVAVMHAGMVGCFFGVVMSLFFRPMLFRLVVRAVDTFSCAAVLKATKWKSNRVMTLWVECFLHSALILCAILMTVDHALGQCYSFYRSNYDTGENSVHLHGQFPPHSIRWLMAFLVDSNIDNLPPQSISRKTIMLPYTWLLYWILILPLTIIIANHYIIQKYLVSCPHPKERGKRIVVARKFFHLVSVVMFVPPTYAAPEMMGLSYAIAVVLLVLLERLRYLVQHHSSMDTRFCGGNDLREDKRDEHEDKHCDDTVLRAKKADFFHDHSTAVPSVNHHLKHSSYPSSLFNVNAFFRYFFDEKDESSLHHGFTVTHIALVIGCAFPLWLDNIIVCPSLSQQHNHHTIWLLMPFAGIIVLGIGDAAGAVYGVCWGKTRWPGGSNRTIEGSAAVFFSMVGCSVIMHWMDSWQGEMHYSYNAYSAFPLLVEALVVWLPLTLIEAATDQIDNMCLPLMAAILLSLL